MFRKKPKAVPVPPVPVSNPHADTLAALQAKLTGLVTEAERRVDSVLSNLKDRDPAKES